MPNLSAFLKHYNIRFKDFKQTGLEWPDLLRIKADYEAYRNNLELPTHTIVQALHAVPKIHSIRYRLKQPYHLVEKIIRKRIDEPDKSIDIHNYKDKINDLIGIRAIHLFKEDWVDIHHFITQSWTLKQPPVAYYRGGDADNYKRIFEKYHCLVKEHPFGYRSVHYLLEIPVKGVKYTAEVQVRTIFEEGWSEIDHSLRYPYEKGNELLNQFLVMFNRLAGSADEMGSYVKHLKREMKKREDEYSTALEARSKIIEDLRLKLQEHSPHTAHKFSKALDEISDLQMLSPASVERALFDDVMKKNLSVSED